MKSILFALLFIAVLVTSGCAQPVTPSAVTVTVTPPAVTVTVPSNPVVIPYKSLAITNYNSAVLEFAELATDASDPGIKWENRLGNWKPAMGTLNGEKKHLTSAYFKQNTYVTTDNLGNILLLFNWDADGSVLIKEITSRMVVNHDRLGIFFGNKLVASPSVNGVISDSGEILGFSQDEAKVLSSLFNSNY